MTICHVAFRLCEVRPGKSSVATPAKLVTFFMAPVTSFELLGAFVSDESDCIKRGLVSSSAAASVPAKVAMAGGPNSAPVRPKQSNQLGTKLPNLKECSNAVGSKKPSE